MINTLPMTLLAHIDDVAVFQTAAFISDDINEPNAKNNQLIPQSQANYGTLNLGLHVNDEAAQVLNNRMRLLAAINEKLAHLSLESKPPLWIKSLHWVNQIHGKQIHDIEGTTLNMKPMAADAMISQQEGLGLAIMTADCVPIVLYQPASGQIAAIHAGWQGLACGVIQSTVQRFTESGPIKAWIGVCISQDNYEVGTHVRAQLLKGCIENKSLTLDGIDSFNRLYVVNSDTALNHDDNAQHLHKTVDKPSSYATVTSEKIKLNLPKLAADQLSAAGVMLDNASLISCSYADEHYYSYRRQTHLQQPATGRMALVIVRGVSA
ncbi:polyphenol oxidase family protein [Psychrobacter vallis]|uniref:polyphenol oxidase family protein n=1 Tax=Psychrobacter vallis TaxID=248451 RepID=UPI00191893C3|nr:polyphenol oxidase family protein [Psychrobacter vallis]